MHIFEVNDVYAANICDQKIGDGSNVWTDNQFNDDINQNFVVHPKISDAKLCFDMINSCD